MISFSPILSNIKCVWYLLPFDDDDDVSSSQKEFFVVVDIIIQCFEFPTLVTLNHITNVEKEHPQIWCPLSQVLIVDPPSVIWHQRISRFCSFLCRSSVGCRVGKNPSGAEQRAGGDPKRSTSGDWRPIPRNWGKLC